MLRLSKDSGSVFQTATVIQSLAISRSRSRTKGHTTPPQGRLSPLILPRLSESPILPQGKKPDSLPPGRVSTLRNHGISPGRTVIQSPRLRLRSRIGRYAVHIADGSMRTEGSRRKFKESRMCWDYCVTESDLRRLLKAKLYSRMEEGKIWRPEGTPLSRKPRNSFRPPTPLKPPHPDNPPRRPLSDFSPVPADLSTKVASSPREKPACRCYWPSVENFLENVEGKYEGLFREMTEGDGEFITTETLNRYFGKGNGDEMSLSLQIYEFQFLSILSVFEYTWNGFPLKRSIDNTHTYNTRRFDPNNASFVRKLTVQVDELRKVYGVLFDEQTGRVKRNKIEGFLKELRGKVVKNEEKGRDSLSFYDFLRAIPIIMTEPKA